MSQCYLSSLQEIDFIKLYLLQQQQLYFSFGDVLGFGYTLKTIERNLIMFLDNDTFLIILFFIFVIYSGIFLLGKDKGIRSKLVFFCAAASAFALIAIFLFFFNY